MESTTTTDTTPTPPPDGIAVAHPAPAQALAYDNKATLQVTRRQVRFFLLLLTVNTLLFAAFICLPSASPFLAKLWEQYQADRAQSAEAAKQRALVDACMNYTAPPDQVVYAEAPAEADKLLARAGRAYLVDGSVRTVGSNGGGGGGGGGGLFGGGDPGARHGGLLTGAPSNGIDPALIEAGWQPPASQGAVEPLVAVAAADRGGYIAQSTGDNVVFLHQMTASDGARRLVWVSFDMERVLRQRVDVDGEYDFTLIRRFNAFVLDGDLQNQTVTTAVIHPPATDRMRLVLRLDAKPELKNRGGHWRVFAGQPDPADPAHFTIRYDIDGAPGVIDGHLRDAGRVMLEPRIGHLASWTNGSEYTWDLSPATMTTQPAR